MNCYCRLFAPAIILALSPTNPAVAGFKIYQPKAIVKLDPTFQVNTETFGEGSL